MVGPWKRVAELELKLALAEQALRTAERDLEREQNEHLLVKQDFKHLVAQVAGNVPAKQGPVDFTRDPFTEDIKIPTEWLTADGELPDIGALEEQLRGEGQAGVLGRPSQSEGDQRQAES